MSPLTPTIESSSIAAAHSFRLSAHPPLPCQNSVCATPFAERGNRAPGALSYGVIELIASAFLLTNVPPSHKPTSFALNRARRCSLS